MSIDNPLNPSQPQPMIAPSPEPSTPDIAPGQPSEPIITDVPMPAPPPPTPPPPGERGATQPHTAPITHHPPHSTPPLPPGGAAGGRGAPEPRVSDD